MRSLFLGLIVLVCGTAFGQGYPAKPVRLIVTYPPGGSSDLMSRVYGAKLSARASRSSVARCRRLDRHGSRQPNDGYTFVVGNLQPVAVNPLLSQVPYSIQKDFVAVSQISAGPNVLVVQADSPFKSLADVIAYAKANPGKLNYGTSGPGSVSHLSSEMLKNITKAEVVEVPYKGGVLAVQDLLAADPVHLFQTRCLPWRIRAEKLRALRDGRSLRALPDQARGERRARPGGGELGGVYPAGTPKNVEAARRHGQGLADADTKKRADLGVETKASRGEFSAFIKAETDKYAKLIKDANIKVNP